MKDMDALEGSRTCAVHGLPDEIDAGAEATMTVAVTSDPKADLTGHAVTVVDAAGETVARAALAPAGEDGETFTTGEIRLRAPRTPGQHRYAIRLDAVAEGDDACPAAEAAVTMTVVAHRVAPVVWDVPEGVTPGARFTVRVGARCSAACPSAGWAITVRDATGTTLARAETGGATWPGTEGLHYAEIALAAPEEIGLFTWEAVVAAPGDGLPHEAGTRRFGVRTTPPADATLRVAAIDAESGAPVEGVKVVVHPFSARTGSDGTACIALPSGRHRIFVSGRHYIPWRAEREVTGQDTLRVELEVDTGLTDAMKWG